MLLFGARLAGGCTSGHGLSGTGLLNAVCLTEERGHSLTLARGGVQVSASATAGMFVGGIGTAVLLKTMGFSL